MRVQKQAKSRVLNVPFSCRNWMEAKDLCISLYFFQLSQHYLLTIRWYPCSEFYSIFCQPQLSSQGTGAWARQKGDPVAAFGVGNREETTWALILLPLPQQGLQEGRTVLTIPPSPGESTATRQHLALPGTAVVIERWVLDMGWRGPNFNTAFR